jgi:hypothetical protein
MPPFQQVNLSMNKPKASGTSFPASGYSIEQQAKFVLDFRLANGLDRATIEQVIEDIDCYTCQRLGCMPQYCYDTDAPYVAPSSVTKKGGCSTCGKLAD